jgi:hypothetical protein
MAQSPTVIDAPVHAAGAPHRAPLYHSKLNSKSMKNLQFKTEIEAGRQQVWYTMLNPET